MLRSDATSVDGPAPEPGSAARRARGLAVGRRPAVVLTIASGAGLVMFLWPLLLSPPQEAGHSTDAPFLFALILPVVIAVVLAELHSGGIDTKALAMLGVLSAIGAAVRPMGAGVAGLETMFFLLVLAGRVYGPGFGFVLGNTTMFASAILTAGIGPWLPFQMMAAGWVGLGAGLLPDAIGGRPLRRATEIAVLSLYGIVASYAYGFLMNMWFWPFAIGTDTALSFVAGDAVWTNLQRFFLFTLATSTLGWDTGRAITTTVAVVVLGPVVLITLRRAVRKAAFDAPVDFVPTP